MAIKKRRTVPDETLDEFILRKRLTERQVADIATSFRFYKDLAEDYGIPPHRVVEIQKRRVDE